MFLTIVLGARWHKRFGIPYVLDFQDPWLSDYYRTKKGHSPPGGHLKYGFSQGLARLLEPYVARSASHVITVSPAYPKMLMNRYSWLQNEDFTTLPFGAAEDDFRCLSDFAIQQKVFEKNDGNRH